MAPLAMSLPEELWDRIIDEYSPRDFEYRLYDSRDYRARSVLWACCLACRNWSPRSRLWLYYDVELQGHDRVCSFLRPIRENPFLAELVHRLTIHPKIAGRHRRSPTSYIPFAAIEMFKKLSKVQCLELVGLFWEDYPPMYYASIARFPITELTLSVSPATWTQVFRLVWALKERKSLHLQACSVSNPASLTASDLERISSLAERRPRCKALRRLIIQDHDIFFANFPPRSAFGNAFVELVLPWWRYPMGRPLLHEEVRSRKPFFDWISCLSSLERLIFISRLDIWDIVQGADEFPPWILWVISRVNSNADIALRLICLKFAGGWARMRDDGWFRIAFWEALFTPPFREVLRALKVPCKLVLEMPWSYARDPDGLIFSGWWKTELAVRLPGFDAEVRTIAA